MGRRRGQQVPGSVTVNRLANGCSYPTSAELKTLSDKRWHDLSIRTGCASCAKVRP